MTFRQRWEQPLLQDALTVAVAYSLTVLGTKIWPGEPQKAPGGPMLPFVLVFTASHAFFPAFVYGQFLKKSPGGCGSVFVYAHMAFWYGVPTAGVATMGGGLALAGAALHIAVAPRGTRLWRAVAYGSAFFALLLLLLMTQQFRHIDTWMLSGIVAYQLVLLRLQSRFASKAFLRPLAK